MKLILTQEVTGLGAPGDVVEVKDGYGRNYLVPRGLAIRWTKGGEKQVDVDPRAREVREIARPRRRRSRSAAGSRASPCTLPVKAGAHGRLFGAVTVADVADGGRRRPAVPRSTSAGSRSASRSRPSATTRSRCACTPRSRRPSTSRSSPPDAAPPAAEPRRLASDASLRRGDGAVSGWRR